MPPVNHPAIPAPMTWDVPAARFERRGDDAMQVVAPAESDLFRDPEGAKVVGNAPKLMFPAQGPCLLSAHVRVGFRAPFDAGGLVAYRDERTWAKLCLERAPDRPTVVSVVTRGTSDDCSSWIVEEDGVWLRLALREKEIAFHASADGTAWSLVRHFALGEGPQLRIGFLVQSPVGEGCEVSFRGVRYRPELLEDIRGGA